MNLGFGVLVSLFSLVAFGFANKAVAADQEEAKKLIEQYKCNRCHSIEAAGIHVIKGAADDKDKEDEGDAKNDRTPPDLSDEGTRHDAEFIAKFMVKKEAIEDRKHGKRFRGTREERETIAEYLASLKDTAAAKKGNAILKANKKK